MFLFNSWMRYQWSNKTRDRTEWENFRDCSASERSAALDRGPPRPSRGPHRSTAETRGKRPWGSWLSAEGSWLNAAGRCARRESTARCPRTAPTSHHQLNPLPPPHIIRCLTRFPPSPHRRAQRASPSEPIEIRTPKLHSKTTNRMLHWRRNAPALLTFRASNLSSSVVLILYKDLVDTWNLRDW